MVHALLIPSGESDRLDNVCPIISNCSFNAFLDLLIFSYKLWYVLSPTTCKFAKASAAFLVSVTNPCVDDVNVSNAFIFLRFCNAL